MSLPQPKIIFQQASRLPRAPHDANKGVCQLEAVVPVPVHEYPQSRHFRLCGVRHMDKPLSADQIEALNQAATRVEIASTQDGFKVVVDGRYVAGEFNLKGDYSGTGRLEVEAAERATQAALRLAEGARPEEFTIRPA